MSNASMSREDDLHVFGTTVTTNLWEKNVTLTQLIEQRGIYGVIKLLVELADDNAYETQDVNDDLIWHVLELTEKQLHGLMLVKLHNAKNDLMSKRRSSL
jgi:hypothetical protein